MVPDMNELRRLLAAGEISEQDLANMSGGNALRSLLNPEQGPIPQPNYDIAPMELNTMRVESGPEAGKVTSLDFGRPQQQPMRMAQLSTDGIYSGGGESQPVAKDFSRPIEIAGKGKGFYSKDGMSAIIDGPNGPERVLLGVDRNASYLANKRAFEQRKQEQDMRAGEVNIERDQTAIEAQRESMEASRAQRSIREDPTSQAVLIKKFGPLEPGKRWTEDGRLEQIAGNQKNTEANEVMDLLKMAEPLLEKSTGSYVGAAVDKAALVFGKSTEGADAAAQLKTLQGALIGKMPKMSGPQSDKDVQLYREMAGQIGDPTIPASQKKSAMETIRQINARYATPGTEPASVTPAAPAGAPRLGEVRKGWRYVGGDPANPKSWKK